jgi:NodT family efflux transporter outer membrane factor (OMF) lipoprotein
MTSFALIFGLLPLALATGAGAIGNRSIGIAAIGGMLIGTLLGVLVIPSLYIIFQNIQEKFSKSGVVNMAGMLLIGTTLAASVSSCQVMNRYRAPEMDTTGLYREDAGGNDTTTVATVPWTSYFTDTGLRALIEEGLRENFDLQTATLRIHEAEADLQVARAAYFPTVGLTGQATHARTSVKDGKTRALGYGADRFSLGVAVQWEADVWGKLNRQARARYAQFLHSREYRRLIQTSLVANIATSYYTLLALDEQLRISHETIGLLEESAASMQAMMDAGMLNAAAVEQSRALLLSTQVSVLSLEVSIRKLENALSVMLGRKPGAIERPSSADWMSPPTPLPHGVPAQMLALRPDVRAAELQFRAAFELRNAAQAAFYPAITIGSGTRIGYDAATLANFFNPENLLANLVVGLTQPLFDGKRLRAQLTVARAQEEAALVNFRQTALTAAREVSDVLFVYEKALEKKEYRTAQAESMRKAAYYTQELLRAGEATYIEVLTAQQNYLSVRLAAVGDDLEKAQAVIDLYRALGGGD